MIIYEMKICGIQIIIVINLQRIVLFICPSVIHRIIQKSIVDNYIMSFPFPFTD